MIAAAAITTFLFTFFFVPVARYIAEKIGAVDLPKEERRMHNYALPRLGGLAVFFGFLVGVLAFVGLNRKIIGLLGKNGQGKTTLIKLINDLLTPTSGEVLINGKRPGVESKK